jgi:subtilase family serine protease
MLARLKGSKSVFLLGAILSVSLLCLASAASAQAARQLVTQTVDETQTVVLSGNTRPEAIAHNDRGAVSDSQVLSHMQLLLKRPAERQAALSQLIEQLHDPQSPNFHQWLTAAQFNTDFGPADADRNAVSDWLGKHGLTVNTALSTGLTIDFSGTAGQVQDAFKTELHHLNVNGVNHLANISDPQIPAALAEVVSGVVSLNDFRPHTNFKPKPSYTYTAGNGSTYHAVVPADLATIYDLNPLFKAGITGQGQTVVVIEDTDVYSTADWSTFRSTFGLSGYRSGSFTQVHPAPLGGANNCLDPGVLPINESEAELDAEWSSAAAPNAAVVLASCQDTTTTFGGLIALQNLLNSNHPPAIVSISYGECEAENGAAANAAYRSIYEEGVVLGTSIFVSSGDEGAASCDADEPTAYHGIGVSGFASTPFNVAVGGTDFGDTSAQTTATYWRANNGATDGSALSYIPEIPWNDSCASVLIATASGYSTTYGANGFCNSAAGKANFLSTASGSGGPSGCATGNPSHGGEISGTCHGYAKPFWQSLVGNPADGVRDIPDVSLFAANGVWGHYYIYCDSDIADEGAACTGAPSGWSGAGGTSFSSPIWAGFQALINQKVGSRQGNPDWVYYPLAAAEYGRAGSNTCNSDLGRGGASDCIFRNVTLGDMDVNCAGSYNCYLPSGSYGVLSLSDRSYLKAYGTNSGWNFATGIGSANITNLVNAWPRY